VIKTIAAAASIRVGICASPFDSSLNSRQFTPQAAKYRPAAGCSTLAGKRRPFMLERCVGFAMCLLLASPVFATDVPPSDASIQALLEITDARQLVDGMRPALNAMMDRVMQQPIDQAGKGKPLYFRLYRQSFTPDDVDAITAFYRTPPAQALLQKMPGLMQNMLSEYQGMVQPLQQQILEIARDTATRLQQPDPTPATHTG
jgi:hypothetical protein